MPHLAGAEQVERARMAEAGVRIKELTDDALGGILGGRRSVEKRQPPARRNEHARPHARAVCRRRRTLRGDIQQIRLVDVPRIFVGDHPGVAPRWPPRGPSSRPTPRASPSPRWPPPPAAAHRRPTRTPVVRCRRPTGRRAPSPGRRRPARRLEFSSQPSERYSEAPWPALRYRPDSARSRLKPMCIPDAGQPPIAEG